MRRVLAFTAAALAAYLLAGPPHDGDFAAQTARADVFGRLGYVPWFAGWYGGVHPPAYSLTTPPLMWWLTPAGLGGASLVLTGLLGWWLLTAGRARRPVLGASALVLFQLADLLSGRVTFAAGAVAVLAGALAAERRHWLPAAGLGLLAAVTSPVDGLLAGIVAGAYLLADRDRRGSGLALGAGAGVGLAAVALFFPDPGYQPFTGASLAAGLTGPLALVLLPVGRRVRTGALLAVVLLLAAYLVHTPVGSNAARPALLLAAPVAVAAARLWRPAVLLAGAALCVLPAVQLAADVSAAGDPGAQAAFYRPLLVELARDPALATHRLEVVEPRTHWQVVYLEPAATLARGWERQVDEAENPLLYGRSPLTPASYLGFLDRNAVAAVALPRGTPLDFESGPEARLVAALPPFLRLVWSSAHWQLYVVRRPAPVATGAGARTVRLTGTGVVFTARMAGLVRLRLRYSSYLTVAAGCVLREPGGTAAVRVGGPGRYDVHAVWSWGGLVRAVTGAGGC